MENELRPNPRHSVMRRALNFQKRRILGFWRIFSRHRIGVIGLAIVFAFILMAVFAPFLSPHDPWQVGRGAEETMNPPSFDHPLGTDDVGRDLLSEVIYGTRISLLVGFLSAAITLLIGGALGLLAGYYGGLIGEIIMRITDSFLCIPWLGLMIILAALLGPGLVNLILVISISTWPTTARIVRSETMSVKERPFVDRARTLGCGDGHIIGRYILPNVMPLISANAILTVSLTIFLEATLSFFGLGDPTQISWGTILHYAFLSSATTLHLWWWLLPPGICIVAIVLGLYFTSLTLDEVLNPRLRTR